MAKGFDITAQVVLRAPKELSTVVSQIKNELNSITSNINLKFDEKTTANIDGATGKIVRFTDALNKLSIQAKATSADLKVLGLAFKEVVPPEVVSSLKTTGNAISVAKTKVSDMANDMEAFGRQSAIAARRFAAFVPTVAASFAIFNAFQNGISEAIDFQTQLVRIGQVSGNSLSNLRSLSDEVGRLSTALGVSSSELVGTAQILAQAGLSAQDTTVALEALAKSTLAPTFKDINNTTEGLIAAMAQFKIEAKDAEKLLGSLNAVAGAFAVESEDLVTNIRRAGAVFAEASAGLGQFSTESERGIAQVQELSAVFTAVRSTTRESAETVSVGLRTIFSRIQRKGTIEFLKQFNIQLEESGKFVGPLEALKRISEGIANIPERSLIFSSIVEELGGLRQISKILPAIRGFATIQDALRIGQAGTDSLNTDAITAQQSLARQFVKTREEFLKLVRELTETSTFKNLVGGLLEVANAAIEVVRFLKPLIPLLTTLAGIKIFQGFNEFRRGFLKELKFNGLANLGSNLGKGLFSGRTKNLDTTPLTLHGLAEGGPINVGSGNKDDVPALLMKGEYVLNKKAVKKIGVKHLDDINFGRFSKFATGGPVGRFAKFNTGGEVDKINALIQKRSDLKQKIALIVSGKEAGKGKLPEKLLSEMNQELRKLRAALGQTTKELFRNQSALIVGGNVGVSPNLGKEEISSVNRQIDSLRNREQLIKSGKKVGPTPQVFTKETNAELKEVRSTIKSLKETIATDKALGVLASPSPPVSVGPENAPVISSSIIGVGVGLKKLEAVLNSLPRQLFSFPDKKGRDDLFKQIVLNPHPDRNFPGAINTPFSFVKKNQRDELFNELVINPLPEKASRKKENRKRNRLFREEVLNPLPERVLTPAEKNKRNRLFNEVVLKPLPNKTPTVRPPVQEPIDRDRLFNEVVLNPLPEPAVASNSPLQKAVRGVTRKLGEAQQKRAREEQQRRNQFFESIVLGQFFDKTITKPEKQPSLPQSTGPKISNESSKVVPFVNNPNTLVTSFNTLQSRPEVDTSPLPGFKQTDEEKLLSALKYVPLTQGLNLPSPATQKTPKDLVRNLKGVDQQQLNRITSQLSQSLRDLVTENSEVIRDGDGHIVDILVKSHGELVQLRQLSGTNLNVQALTNLANTPKRGVPLPEDKRDFAQLAKERSERLVQSALTNENISPAPSEQTINVGSTQNRAFRLDTLTSPDPQGDALRTRQSNLLKTIKSGQERLKELQSRLTDPTATFTSDVGGFSTVDELGPVVEEFQELERELVEMKSALVKVNRELYRTGSAAPKNVLPPEVDRELLVQRIDEDIFSTKHFLNSSRKELAITQSPTTLDGRDLIKEIEDYENRLKVLLQARAQAVSRRRNDVGDPSLAFTSVDTATLQRLPDVVDGKENRAASKVFVRLGDLTEKQQEVVRKQLKALDEADAEAIKNRPLNSFEPGFDKAELDEIFGDNKGLTTQRVNNLNPDTVLQLTPDGKKVVRVTNRPDVVGRNDPNFDPLYPTRRRTPSVSPEEERRILRQSLPIRQDARAVPSRFGASNKPTLSPLRFNSFGGLKEFFTNPDQFRARASGGLRSFSRSTARLFTPAGVEENFPTFTKLLGKTKSGISSPLKRFSPNLGFGASIAASTAASLAAQSETGTGQALAGGLQGAGLALGTLSAVGASGPLVPITALAAAAVGAAQALAAFEKSNALKELEISTNNLSDAFKNFELGKGSFKDILDIGKEVDKSRERVQRAEEGERASSIGGLAGIGPNVSKVLLGRPLAALAGLDKDAGDRAVEQVLDSVGGKGFTRTFGDIGFGAGFKAVLENVTSFGTTDRGFQGALGDDAARRQAEFKASQEARRQGFVDSAIKDIDKSTFGAKRGSGFGGFTPDDETLKRFSLLNKEFQDFIANERERGGGTDAEVIARLNKRDPKLQLALGRKELERSVLPGVENERGQREQDAALKALTIRIDASSRQFQKLAASVSLASDNLDAAFNVKRGDQSIFSGQLDLTNVDLEGRLRELGKFDTIDPVRLSTIGREVAANTPERADVVNKATKELVNVRILQDELSSALASLNQNDPKNTVDGLLGQFSANLRNIGVDPESGIVKEFIEKARTEVNKESEANDTEFKKAQNLFEKLGELSSNLGPVAQRMLEGLVAVEQADVAERKRVLQAQQDYANAIVLGKERLLQVQEIRAEQELKLAEALGKTSTLQQLNRPADVGLEALVGTADVGAIGKEFNTLADGLSKGLIQKTPQVAARLAALQKALEKAAGDTSRFSNALQKASEARNKVNTAEDFALKVFAETDPVNLLKQQQAFGLAGQVQKGDFSGLTALNLPNFLSQLDDITGLIRTFQGEEAARGFKRNALRGAAQVRGLDANSPFFKGLTKLDEEEKTAIQKAVEAAKIQTDAATSLLSAVQKLEAFASAQLANLPKPQQGATPIGRNKGGIIPGRGPNKDTVLSHLTKGEFVVNRSATDKNLELLQAINNGYVDGGIITDVKTTHRERAIRKALERKQRLGKDTSRQENLLKAITGATSPDEQKLAALKVINLENKTRRKVRTPEERKSLVEARRKRSLELKRIADRRVATDNYSEVQATTEKDRLFITQRVREGRIRKIAKQAALGQFTGGASRENKAVLAAFGNQSRGGVPEDVQDFISKLSPRDREKGSALFRYFSKVAANDRSKIDLAKFNTGGSAVDNIPAMLTKGEFVVNADAAKANRALLEHLNKGGRIRGYQNGGIVRQPFDYVDRDSPTVTPVKQANYDTFAQAISSFGKYVDELAKINIPERIIMEVAPIEARHTLVGETELARFVANAIKGQMETMIANTIAKHINGTTGEVKDSFN